MSASGRSVKGRGVGGKGSKAPVDTSDRSTRFNSVNNRSPSSISTPRVVNATAANSLANPASVEGLGGSLYAADKDPEMEVLHNEGLKLADQVQKLIAGSRFTNDSLSNKRAPLGLEEGNVVADTFADSFSEVFKKGKYLKDGDLDELKGISGIEEGTSENYKRDWHFWPDFLVARDQLCYLFLDDLDALERSGLVSLFIIWLRKRIRCSDSKITCILSGVRYAFVKAGVNASCFEDPLVQLAKKTLGVI